MPRTKKMCGDDSSSDEGDGIFDSINTGSKRAVRNIKALGDGLRVKMSKAQHRTLKRGGKITIKPEMLHEMGEFVPMAEHLMKKAMKAMNKGKGIRISQSPTGIPTNAESLLGEASPQPQMGGKGYRFGDFLNDIRPVTDFLRPLAEAGRDKGVEKIKGYGTHMGHPDYALFKKMRGKGYHFRDFLNDIRPVTDFLRPLAEAGRDKGVEKIKGYGMKGRGKLTITHGEGTHMGHPDYALFKKMRGKGYHFRDFLNDIRPVTDFLRPLAEAGRDKGVEKIQGYGIEGGSFLAAGGISTAITAGNSGMLQLGSPYAHPGSQAMRPPVPPTSQLSGTNKISTHKSSRIYRK